MSIAAVAKRNHVSDRLLLVVSTLLLAVLACNCSGRIASSSIPAEAWQSPNLLVDNARLDAIRQAVAAGDPSISSAYAGLLQTADRFLNETSKPIIGELRVPGFYTRERETQQRITRQLRHDARAAHALALAHALSGRAEYAAKAKSFLFAWVRNVTRPANGGHWWHLWEYRGDTLLVVSYAFPCFIYAFELLKGSDQLTEEEIAAFRSWLRPFAGYCRKEVFYKNNHHNWQTVFLMCAAHALEDPALFDRAVQYYRHGIRSQIRADGGLPRELHRKEKAGTYTLMALEGMTQAVHLAERHGYTDLRAVRSRKGGDLERAIDFYIEYLRDPAGWAKHTNAGDLNKPDDPADWGYILELPNRWWKKDAYSPYLAKRPYGFDVPRCYTLDFATLYFCPVEGEQQTRTPAK